MDSENGKGKGKAKAKEKVKKGGKKAASSSASSSEESGETSSGGETFLFIQDKLVHKFFRQSQFFAFSHLFQNQLHCQKVIIATTFKLRFASR